MLHVDLGRPLGWAPLVPARAAAFYATWDGHEGTFAVLMEGVSGATDEERVAIQAAVEAVLGPCPPPGGHPGDCCEVVDEGLDSGPAVEGGADTLAAAMDRAVALTTPGEWRSAMQSLQAVATHLSSDEVTVIGATVALAGEILLADGCHASVVRALLGRLADRCLAAAGQ